VAQWPDEINRWRGRKLFHTVKLLKERKTLCGQTAVGDVEERKITRLLRNKFVMPGGLRMF